MSDALEPDDRGPEDPRSAAPASPAAADRGISPIAGRLGGRGPKIVTLAALGIGCAVLLYATWDRGDADERITAEVSEPPRQRVPFEPARREDAAPSLSDDTDSSAPPGIAAPGEPVPNFESGATQPAGPSTAEERRTLLDEARRSPVLAYSRPGSASPDPHAGAIGGAAAEPPGQARATALDALRQGSTIGRARAGVLGDRNLILTAGASIPCILSTAMDSATPGLVSCILPRDVYSESGAVVLMERGTRVLGEYQGGLQQGRERLFVLWTRAVTPAGVTIGLASPAADALGRAGFDGRVDTRFWDRFGGALLLSLVDDGLYAAVGRDDDLRETARIPSDAAGVAMRHSVDIPATLRKAQGAEVSIFVAQDLDFSGVYRLSAR